MNPEAKIDNLLVNMSKPYKEPEVVFSSEERANDVDYVDDLKESRLLALLKRSKLTTIDIKLLDVLLKNRDK